DTGRSRHCSWRSIRACRIFLPESRLLKEILTLGTASLRRTCVSGMARLGVAPHVADKILNHQSGTISGVAAVYQRHEFLAERRAALDLWGAHIGQLLGEISHDRQMDLKIVA